ncbi:MULTISPECIES: hypothetical protein [unclassified Frankia]|uniref:hypothetical protein n=1 Tax=unclassified Frankia TaxID=2632575 RepID=UPI002AD1D6D2|nr:MULTISPECIES: hypothetical protein [unclassified Frankia]
MLTRSAKRVLLPIFLFLLALSLCLLPGSVAQATTPAASAASAASPAASAVPAVHKHVVVNGRVGHRLRLSFGDLRAFPQHTQDVDFLSGKGPEHHTYVGPLLLDVLKSAAPSFNPGIKNDSLRYAILIKASDGYESVLSWPEIDPNFGGKQALLAVSEDGVPLDSAGPRLTAPGDSRGGRYVFSVVSVTLIKIGD